jgi:hypothetical protein
MVESGLLGSVNLKTPTRSPTGSVVAEFGWFSLMEYVAIQLIESCTMQPRWAAGCRSRQQSAGAQDEGH